MQIKHLKISKDSKPIIIAEIGINHGGSLEVAKQMVDAAVRAGVDIVKHQTHIVEDEMSKVAKKVIPGNSDKSIYEIMQRCALSEADEFELMQYTQQKGLIFISTPFSRAAALRLERFGVPAYKIGSGEMNNYPLLKLIASFKKPTIISTGMNDIASIKKAVKIFENTPIALLHTTNLYPTPPHLVRLGAMQEMMKEFPNIPIGLSDHTLNNNSSIAALALGACIIERHFTDTYERVGEDIICSMDESAAKELVKARDELFLMRGGKKCAAKEEKVTIDFAFATCVAIKDIKKGEAFSEENLWVKRPGTGEIKAEFYESLLGKTANKDIKNDTHISWDMVQK